MSRISTLSARLYSDQEAALITSDENRLYFTGFSSSAGVVLVMKSRAVLLIDFRYFEKAKQFCHDAEVVLMENMREQLSKLISDNGITHLLIESDTMTLRQYNAYKEQLFGVQLDDTGKLSDMISAMRIIKSDEEIQCISAAQAIAERAFTKLINSLKAGISEKKTAAMLNYFMMDFGADDLSFATIAASGVNSASPHAVPTEKKLVNGEFLTLDFGAVVNGYHSDMTRTVVIGRPTDKMKEVYAAVYSANTDAIKAVKAGISAKLLDNIARSTLSAWGYEEYFGHALGHGVGLEIHEAPSVSKNSGTTLKNGMIITIEPGVYIPNEFGVRIEDMLVVRENGCENLARLSKALITV